MGQKNMRLVDADDVVDSLKNWFIMHRHYHPYSKSNLIPATEVIDIINRSPTIEERKTGTWFKRTVIPIGFAWDAGDCSVCGGRCIFGEGTPNYCPHCGADMRGGEGR